MNNNTPQFPQEKLGLVDDISSNSQIGETIKYLESNNKRPVDDGRPTVKALVYADELDELCPGTILSSHVFEHSSSGISEVSSYSVNTVEQDEARIRQIDLEATQGRSIYNAPPKSSGAPSIAEIEKPTQEQLSQAQKESQINSLTQKLRLLNDEEGALQLRLVGIEIARKKAKDELQQLQ